MVMLTAARLDQIRADDVEPYKRRIAKLEAALKPFADRVYNDNGDVTFSTGILDTEDLWRAYSVLKHQS